MHSNRSSALFSILVFLSSVAGVFACAWFDESEFYYSFFSPETSRSVSDAPFFRSFNMLYTGYAKEDNVADFVDVNVAEWNTWFDSLIPAEELRHVLYKASTGEIDSLVAGTANQRASALTMHHGDARARSFLSYLRFAKKCEPYVTYIAYWTWDSSRYKNDPRRNTEAMGRITEEGIRTLAGISDPFLRERYHFQILRMLFHQRKYKDCHAYFRRHESELSPRRSMLDRSAGYAAGALYRLKRYTEANYLYSLLFDRNTVMRVDAFISFHPQEESDWKRTLAIAKSPRERAVLWQMLGIYADPLRAMREIRAIDPGSELLDLLLVRAVNIAEDTFMPDRLEIAGDSVSGYALKGGTVDPELLAFVTRTARDGGTHRAYLWDLAAGYLLTVRGDYTEAEGFLAKARAGAVGDTLVQEQAHVTDVIRMVESQETLDTPFEARIVSELKWLEDSSRARALRNAFVLDWARKRLSQKYAEAGEAVKAQCLYQYSDQNFYQDPEKQAMMITYMDQPEKTDFDRYLLSIHPFSRSDIFELQALQLFYEGKLEHAIARFREQPGSGATVLKGDPFLIHINDCHDCDHAAPQARKYTKLEFAERLLELERLAALSGDSAAHHAFALANGYYNATFWGNARVMYESNLREYMYVDLWNPDPALRVDPVMDCSRALRWYLKARDLSRDREFKARCTFMAAKCEQNAFYLNKPPEYKGNFRAGTYFAQLRKSYAGTRYYKEVIAECGYFRTYASRMKRRR